MVVAIIQAYECRRVTTEYSESLWISGSIATVAQLWIIGLPILRLVEDDPRAVFLTKVGVVFGSSILTLALTFVPKLGHLWDALGTKKDATRISNALRAREVEAKDPSRWHQNQRHSDTQSNSEDGLDDDDGRRGDEPSEAGAPAATAGAEKITLTRGEPLGVRIIPTAVLHSDEVDKLQTAVDKVEARHKSLQQSLERLQEKLEHHIIARDPLGPNQAAAAAAAEAAAAAAASFLTAGPSRAVNGSDHGHRHHSHYRHQHHYQHPQQPQPEGRGSRERIGNNSILAARPGGLLPPSTH